MLHTMFQHWPSYSVLQIFCSLVLVQMTDSYECGSYKDLSAEPTIFESAVLPDDECCRASVGNGYLATVVYSDTVYMNGVYNGRLGESHRARIPSTAAIKLRLMENETMVTESYQLDVEHGIFLHHLEATSAIVTHRIYAHQLLTRLLINEIAITRKEIYSGYHSNKEVTDYHSNQVKTKIHYSKPDLPETFYQDKLDENEHNNQNNEKLRDSSYHGNKHLKDHKLLRSGDILGHGVRKDGYHKDGSAWSGGNQPVTVFLTRNRGKKSEDIDLTIVPPIGNSTAWFASGRTLTSETNTSSTIPLYTYWTDLPSNITLSSSKSSLSHTFITALSNDEKEALEMYSLGQQMARKGSLYSTHISAWVKKWGRGRIDVPGNLQLAKAIYGSMYYILSSLPPLEAPDTYPFTFWGLSPGTLANGGAHRDYMGHIFWDQETWMFPPILLFHPELARVILRTRTMHLQAARENAAKYGNKGARFPWESARTGAEVCPAQPYGRDEIHINGDIAFAIQQYLYATNDTEFLTADGGFDLITGLAEFWASRVTYNETLKAYTICNVMPPDEYHDLVNNSVYTNTVAQVSLFLPQYAAGLINKSVPSEWAEIAANMYIPYDEALDYHPEFDGYRIGSKVKQADAILLGFPLMTYMKPSTRASDLQIYENVTDPNGPAMTWSMFAIGWLDLGYQEKAAQQFSKMFANVQEPFKIWTETAQGTGAVNFITGMGGFLQAVVMGYGGLRLHSDSLQVNFTLPNDTTDLRMRGLNYLGNSLDFAGNSTTITVELTEKTEAAVDLTMVASEYKFKLVVDQPVHLRLQPFNIKPSNWTAMR